MGGGQYHSTIPGGNDGAGSSIYGVGHPLGERTRLCGPHHGKGPKGFQRSDERIKEMVSEALTDDGFVDATNIAVEVRSGEVTLTGTVDDRSTKRMAEDVVERVVGVKDVHNQLRVEKPDR